MLRNIKKTISNTTGYFTYDIRRIVIFLKIFLIGQFYRFVRINSYPRSKTVLIPTFWKIPVLEGFVTPEVDDFILGVDPQDHLVAGLDGGVGGQVVGVEGHEEAVAVNGSELEGVIEEAFIVGSFFVPAIHAVDIGGIQPLTTSENGSKE